MNGIKEINIEGDRLFLKKSEIFGWGVVYPIKIDGKINWKNLLIGGSWIRFIIIIMAIILLYISIQEYSNIVGIANNCLNQNKIIILS